MTMQDIRNSFEANAKAHKESRKKAREHFKGLHQTGREKVKTMMSIKRSAPVRANSLAVRQTIAANNVTLHQQRLAAIAAIKAAHHEPASSATVGEPSVTLADLVITK